MNYGAPAFEGGNRAYRRQVLRHVPKKQRATLEALMTRTGDYAETEVDSKPCGTCGKLMGLHPKPDYSPCPDAVIGEAGQEAGIVLAPRDDLTLRKAAVRKVADERDAAPAIELDKAQIVLAKPRLQPTRHGPGKRKHRAKG